ncbi:MAG: hypothetical protein OXU61_00040 [Gammaproteobacteria bacterium]|nr:hypothetical protein [Gammaproteobacteria bacterium]MDD9824157.1 hypothetical protein [Gammaproteobacteria bacterium]MDD9863142.1 hypothetical protein [Gammaproteobacteria bacterium]
MNAKQVRRPPGAKPPGAKPRGAAKPPAGANPPARKQGAFSRGLPLDAVLAVRLASRIGRARMENITERQVVLLQAVLGGGAAALLLAGALLLNFLAGLLLVGFSFFGEFAKIVAGGRPSHLVPLCKAGVLAAVFICMGLGQIFSLGVLAVFVGLLAGVFLAAYVGFVAYMQDRVGQALKHKSGGKPPRMPTLFGYSWDDLLYLMPVFALFKGGLSWVLVAAIVGAPLAALLAAWHYYRLEHADSG